MTAYLDASALVSMFLTDAHTPAIDRWIKMTLHQLCTSQLGTVEFASALSIRLRRHDVTYADASKHLVSLDHWQRDNARTVKITSADFDHAEKLVRQFELKLRGPDALHVAVCARIGATMITFDAALANAMISLGLTVEIPS
jgi:uncharacterized protein